MADWSLLDREWSPNQYDPFQYAEYNPYYQEKPQPQPMAPCQTPQAQPYLSPSSPPLTLLLSSPQNLSPPAALQYANNIAVPKGDNPREIRNKAEKQRRDKLNQSIGELAAMVPPVVAASRKIDKTGVLRLTAHYLRAHQYVFGDSIGQSAKNFNSTSVRALLGFLKGFLLTTTYKGLIVVVSQNVNEYLGYTELELLGQSIFNLTHEDDHKLLKEQLMPRSHMLGPNGELLVPDERDGREKITEALANEKRRFVVRFKKLGQRSEPCQYVTCHVEGSLRKSDRACRGYNRCCQMVRRARARGDNPCSSGNDVVFIGVVRPTTETFITESGLESFRMEYRTRHSIDGEIIQCEQRIALVTGYMTHEVNGVNAMNFMHRDDVRWVIIALRDMYDKHRLFGESCYRLMTKNGQFIYMRTRGRLDVDKDSRAVTSFVCTNTVVEEQEGKQLIKMMKKKFTVMVNNNEDTEEEQTNDSQSLPVEDPRQLEKVILHLVTNLPSPQSEDYSPSVSPDCGESLSNRLAIIPPRKERIISAIEKIYNVIKTIPKEINQWRGSVGSGQIVNQSGIKSIVTDTESQQVIQLAKITQNVLPGGPCRSSAHLKQESHEKSLLPSPIFSNTSSSSDINSHRQLENTSTMTAGSTNIVQYNTVNPSPVEITNREGISLDAYTRMSTITFADINSRPNPDVKVGNTKPQTKVKYHVFIAPRNLNAESSTVVQPAILMGPNPAGVKRPNDFEDYDTVTKKKVTDVNNEQNQNEQISSSPDLETFFDEAILNTQIESAINSLEQSIDPTFPDLLISNEVQDILKEIEDEPYDEHRESAPGV